MGSYSRTAAQTEYTPTSNLPANTLLYWRVQTRSTAYGPSAWTDWRMMDMPNPPSVPLLVAPAANALVLPEAETKFDWGNSTVPTGTTFDHYQVAIFRDSACTYDNWIRNEDPVTSDKSFTFSNLEANTKFYWAVRAFNVDDEYSAWSACRVFRTAVEAPMLLEPVSGETQKTNRPTFKWQPVVGATSYTIQVSRNATFTSIVTSGTCDSKVARTFCRLAVVAKNWTLTPRCLKRSSSFGAMFCDVVMRPPEDSIADLTSSDSSALARLAAGTMALLRVGK